MSAARNGGGGPGAVPAVPSPGLRAKQPPSVARSTGLPCHHNAPPTSKNGTTRRMARGAMVRVCCDWPGGAGSGTARARANEDAVLRRPRRGIGYPGSPPRHVGAAAPPLIHASSQPPPSLYTTRYLIDHPRPKLQLLLPIGCSGKGGPATVEQALTANEAPAGWGRQGGSWTAELEDTRATPKVWVYVGAAVRGSMGLQDAETWWRPPPAAPGWRRHTSVAPKAGALQPAHDELVL